MTYSLHILYFPCICNLTLLLKNKHRSSFCLCFIYAYSVQNSARKIPFPWYCISISVSRSPRCAKTTWMLKGDIYSACCRCLKLAGAQNTSVRSLRVWFHCWFKPYSELVAKEEVTPWVPNLGCMFLLLSRLWLARTALWKVSLPRGLVFSQIRSFHPLPGCRSPSASQREERAGQDLPFWPQQGRKSNEATANLHLNYPY